MVKEKVISSEKLADVIVDAIQDVKGKSVTKLDLRGVDNAVCDFFILCSGESNTQVDGINNSIQRKTREILQEKPWHAEGTYQGLQSSGIWEGWPVVKCWGTKLPCQVHHAYYMKPPPPHQLCVYYV